MTASSDRWSGSDSGNLDFLVFLFLVWTLDLDTGLCTDSRSTTDHFEREIRCCAYYNYGSCFFPLGRGSPARLFLRILLVAPDSPSPSACTHLSPKWSTMVCRPDRRQDPKDMQKAIPSLYPSWLFSWAIEECCRTRNTVPDNLMGNWLPRTAAQQGISCHEMARTRLRKIRHPSIHCCVVRALIANRRRSLFPIPQNNAGIQLGNHTHHLVSFLKILKIVLTSQT